MIIILLILLLACFQVNMIDYLYNNPTYYQLDAYTLESDQFRAMELGSLLSSQKDLDYNILTTLMVEHDYNLTDVKALTCNPKRLSSVKPVEYRKLSHAYEMLLEDLKYFPIPSSNNQDTPPVVYENGWLAARSYGGERKHEGCDIMGNQMPRGYYPVISMSDGVVEKVGWLEQGGFRIGIRTPGGVYLYYAHLYDYSREWNEGDVVKAGQLLGFMGDTGYSTIEGTTGNFDVHLHLGIYIKTDHFDELSINPYWILKYLEKNQLQYSY